MDKINKSSKIILTFIFICGALWLGAYVSRLMAIYQLFDGVEFILKKDFNDENLRSVFIATNPIIVANIILFSLFLILFVIFLSTSKLKLKNNGWLFIIVVIIISTAPLELYLLSIDYEIITKVLSGNFSSKEILNFTIKRIKNMGSFSIIEILSYFSIIFLIIFKPFVKSENEN